MALDLIFKWLTGLIKAVDDPYLEVFLASLIGNLTLFVPIPYLALVFTISMRAVNANLSVLAFIGALGGTAGKFLSYAVGYGGAVALGKKYEKKFDSLKKLLGGSPFIAAFLFAASPLPDDLVFIPLGVIKYSPLKTFVGCLAGKFIITFLTVWLGRFSGEAISWFFGEGSYMAIVASILVLIISIILILKVDWEKIMVKAGRRFGIES